MATPASPADYGEHGNAHLRGLLEEFLSSDDVVDELAKLVDPRPDTAIDFASLVASMEERGFDRSHFPDFDLAAFLYAFAREFHALAAAHGELQEMLKVRLLGQLLGEAGRTANATEEIAGHTGAMASELRELKQLVRAGPEHKLLQVVQIFAGAGSASALEGYEALVAALSDQGLALSLDAGGEVLEIDGGTFAGERALPPARRGALESAAMELRRAVVSVEPTEGELAQLETRYRRHLIRWFSNLTFQGMMRAPRPIVLPLEKVYVELRAVAEVPEAADAFSVEERRLLLEVEDEEGRAGEELAGEELAGEGRVDRGRGRELMSQLDALRRERWSRTLPDRQSMAEALHGPEHRAFVILGDPGSGKTTLLHYLALVYARGAQAAAERLGVAEAQVDRLPIFAPLAAFDELRGRNPGLTLRQFLALYYDVRRGLPGLGPLSERAIDSGRALVLLDGLDEVIDVQTRRFVAEQVSALIGEWTPRGVRFALSSRVVGYREAPVTAGATTLTVLDFGEREIRTFVRQWARAFEVWSAGGESPEVLRRAQALESDVMEDVRSNPSVRRLAANPLMLTMLALLRRQTGIRLPHRRIELYESYVKTLLENWVYARSLDAREQSLDLLDRHQAENVLIPLALWLQREKPSGTAGQVKIHRKLTEICLEEEGLSREQAGRKQLRQAQAMAKRFLREMREMSGLIVERGHDAFGFLHLTFQEYFAGRALARKGGDERWAIVREHLHDPRWREPLMLCAGRLGVVENRRGQVTDLVRAILDHEDPSEADLHRHLLLALAIACDDVYLEPQLMERLVASAVDCLPAQVHALGRAVMGPLAQLVANGATDVESCFAAVWACDDWWSRWYAVEVLARFASEPGVRKCLLARLSDNDRNVIGATFKALSSQVGSDASVRGTVLEKLNDDDLDVRQFALSALSSAVGSDALVRGAVLGRLNDDDEDVRQSAVSALSSAVGSDASVRGAVLERLNDSYAVRQSAVSALSSAVGSGLSIRATVLGRLNDGSSSVRKSALRALSSHVGSDTVIREAVLERLNDDHYAVRRSAVSALSSHVDSDAAIRAAVLERLNDGHWGVRRSAVSALSSHVGSDASVRGAVLERLNDDDEDVRGAALRSLAGRLLTDSRIFGVIQEELHNDSWQVRQALAEVVGESAADPEHVRLIHQILCDATAPEAAWCVADSLVAVSESQRADMRVPRFAFRNLQNQYWQARQSAVIALSSHVGSDGEIRGAVLERLNDDQWQVRQSAVSALSSQLGSDSAIREAVLERLNDDQWQVRQSAVSALSSHLGSDPEINEIMLKRLDDGSHLVRQSAINVLSSLVGSNSEIRGAVLERLNDDHYGVRKFAVSALSNHVGSDGEIRGAVLERLNDDDWQVRKSAMSVLSSLVGSDGEIRGAVLEGLNDDDWHIRQAAVSALSSHVGSDSAIRGVVLERLNDDDWQVRQCAVSALSSHVGSD